MRSFKILPLLSQNTLVKLASFSIFAGLLLRILYAINVDPLSGQDAPSYYPSALRILEKGIFANDISAPAFPVGYTWFVAAVFSISGSSLLALSMFQIMVFTYSLWKFRVAVEILFNKEVSSIFCILISLSPAQISAVTLVMYEIPMMSLFMLGAALFIEAFYGNEEHRYFWLKITISGLLFAWAISMQPKVLAAIVVFILLFMFSTNSQSNENFVSKEKKVVAMIVALVFVALGPSSLLIRNYIAGDGLGLTQNYATNIIVGAQNTGVSLDTSRCEQFTNVHGYDSLQRSVCLQRIKFSNISGGLDISRQQMVNFWLPYIGDLKFRGTWYHALDFRRIFPSYEYWRGTEKLVDQVLGWIWVSLFLTYVVVGCRLAYKRFGIPKTLILLLPICSLWLVSISTYGESRYRIPIAFLYYVLIAIALWGQISRARNHLEDKPPLTLA